MAYSDQAFTTELILKREGTVRMSMAKLQEFQSAARENGYAEANEDIGRSTCWLRKATPDAGTAAHKRMCIDSVTDSATVFWQTIPAKLNSKTFRTASSLKDWFGSSSK
jgi:hypothetical protein